MRLHTKIKGLVVFAASAVAIPQAADAALVITITQVGSGVDATVDGSLDLSGLTRGSAVVLNRVGIASSPGYLGFGGDNVVLASYTGFTGGGFGTAATFTPASTSPGTDFAFDATASGQPLVLLPLQFSSGGTIAAQNTFAGSSLASLGLTAGRYVYRSSGDTITINVADAATAVPEPAGWATMILGFGVVGSAIRRRRPRIGATAAYA